MEIEQEGNICREMNEFQSGDQFNNAFFDKSARYHYPFIEEGKVYKMNEGKVEVVPKIEKVAEDSSQTNNTRSFAMQQTNK